MPYVSSRKLRNAFHLYLVLGPVVKVASYRFSVSATIHGPTLVKTHVYLTKYRSDIFVWLLIVILYAFHVPFQLCLVDWSGNASNLFPEIAGFEPQPELLIYWARFFFVVPLSRPGKRWDSTIITSRQFPSAFSPVHCSPLSSHSTMYSSNYWQRLGMDYNRYASLSCYW